MINMNISIEPVLKEEKEILKNLLEKYDYEFSQYDLRDVNCLGLYGYDYLDCYWTDEKRFPFFIKADGKLAGFAMINDYAELCEDADYIMAEFFVLYKYRRMGLGKTAAFELFRKFPGKWELKRHLKNLISVAFWDNVVKEYTDGHYAVFPSGEENAYPDGTMGEILVFNT